MIFYRPGYLKVKLLGFELLIRDDGFWISQKIFNTTLGFTWHTYMEYMDIYFYFHRGRRLRKILYYKYKRYDSEKIISEITRKRNLPTRTD